MLEKTLKLIENFIEISPRKLERIEELSDEIIHKTRKLEKYFKEEEDKDKYSKIIQNIEKSSKKLSNDIKRSKFSDLKSEWKKLAVQDFSKLKTEVKALQELLLENKDDIEKQMEKEKHGFDTESLLNHLKNDEDISKSTRSQISKLLKDLSEEEVEKRIENNKKRLKRISKLIIIKKEVKNDF